jgi:UDP-N-acetylmuramoyl-tripeptide--D-alanyl-D-alanine ligase
VSPPPGGRPDKIGRMLWTVDSVAAATGGHVTTPDGGAVVLHRIDIDSRHLTPGALFVPVRAERDGHRFVAAAVQAGAAGYLWASGFFDPHRPEVAGSSAIEVADTGAALLDLGRAARSRLRGPVVGITGSVGKTSTKDLLAAALATELRVAASEKSLNNELGVPLTLANAPEDAAIAVIEMGARGIGQIAVLCEVARPTIAVVTSVAAVHTELFGSIDAVAETKGELVEAVGPKGLAVLNADDDRVLGMARRTSGEVLRYSALGASGADIIATDVRIADDLRPSFVLTTPWGTGAVTLGVRGGHQVGNALAAATVALHQGVTWEAVVGALGAASLSPWRMELLTSASGATVLNDAYNANPASMAAALRALALLPARRRVAVVGIMAELGADAVIEHRRIATLADELGIELVAVDTADYGRVPVVGIDEAVEALGPLGHGDAVLVKASRVGGLERLALRLLQPAP